MAIKDLFQKFKKGLAKTAQLFNVRSWFGRKVDQSFLDELEGKLIQADVGVAATSRIIEGVRAAFADKTADENLLAFVKDELKALLADPRPGTLATAPQKPTVILVAGVNGSGKTTSIAKLAQYLKDEGHTILLAACDTFRAAAADQLSIWAQRSGSDIVKGAPGSDPASVAHDACERALARQIDTLIVDTAGRLH
ncbi:MAG TPA: signal recognition particle receptor subunit alpha, partial [Isosphaeraceae bacterium]|nr:signal recognition particle receptor subunit alpha [Isosphaeraceae bacterium]